ncbi:MAG: hypothetical protein J6Z31_01255 [Fibrobacter sp.]|nr:hypothetical protein [Fibrobacter sp.]
MKYDILKSVSLLALFAAFTTVMFACDNGSDPSAPVRTPTESSSSAAPLMSSIPVTEVSPIRFQQASCKPNADETIFYFNGSAILDGWDTTANADSENDPFFTGMTLTLAHVNELGQNEQTPLQLTYTMPSFPQDAINLGQMGVSIVDTAKTQCGPFKLFVVLNATNDPAIPDKFISVDSVEFVRSEEACMPDPEPVSSSAADIIVSDAELNQYTGQMSTSLTYGFSFTTGTEVPMAEAQIRVQADEAGTLSLYGVNGYRVVKYNNDRDKNFDDDYGSKYLPPTPAHISDFRFTESKLAESTEKFDIDFFVVVVGPAFNADTGDDFYAITLADKSVPDGNGVRTLSVIYYKK